MIVLIGVQSLSATDNNEEVCERPDKFKCNNGECTKLAYVCNSINDCKCSVRLSEITTVISDSNNSVT